MRFLICVSAAAALSFSQSSFAQDETKEALVKAAFIYNFSKFVEWPPERKATSAINLCFAGSNPFTAASSVFSEAAKKGQVFDLLEESKWKSAPANCHILFIARSESSRVAQLLDQINGASVLTVSDADDFVTKGGTIGFVPKDNKVRLAINIKNAAKHKLRIDAQLLEIAANVIRE